MSDNLKPDFDTGIMVNPEDGALWTNEKGELYTYPLSRGVRIACNQSSFVMGAEPGRIIVRMLAGGNPPKASNWRAWPSPCPLPAPAKSPPI